MPPRRATRLKLVRHSDEEISAEAAGSGAWLSQVAPLPSSDPLQKLPAAINGKGAGRPSPAPAAAGMLRALPRVLGFNTPQRKLLAAAVAGIILLATVVATTAAIVIWRFKPACRMRRCSRRHLPTPRASANRTMPMCRRPRSRTPRKKKSNRRPKPPRKSPRSSRRRKRSRKPNPSRNRKRSPKQNRVGPSPRQAQPLEKPKEKPPEPPKEPPKEKPKPTSLIGLATAVELPTHRAARTRTRPCSRWCSARSRPNAKAVLDVKLLGGRDGSPPAAICTSRCSLPRATPPAGTFRPGAKEGCALRSPACAARRGRNQVPMDGGRQGPQRQISSAISARLPFSCDGQVRLTALSRPLKSPALIIDLVKGPADAALHQD